GAGDRPDFKDIPKGETKIGEMIGHRFWLIEATSCLLWSYTQSIPWYPGEPVEGNPRNYRDIGHNWRGLGVYSFKSTDLLMTEINRAKYQLRDHLHHNVPWKENLGSIGQGNLLYIDCIGFVYGTVEMWGDVVEHEYGFRSQYAKIVTLDGFIGIAELYKNFDKIKRRYERKG